MRLVESDEFGLWLESLEATKPGYVVFNNSYQKRDGSTTRKHHHYLAGEKAEGHETPVIETILLAENIRLNKNFALHTAGSKGQPLASRFTM